MKYLLDLDLEKIRAFVENLDAQSEILILMQAGAEALKQPSSQVGLFQHEKQQAFIEMLKEKTNE